jgi:ResB-like family
LGLDSMLRVYLADRMYLIRYGHRQLELAFPLKLIKFTVGYDEGTEKAASYESLVNVPTKGLVKISMNEPLQFQGFTFYQSSFEKNERGEPVASILSANHDPGRWIKYAGSMMMVLGSILLFYFKRVQWFSHLKKKGSGS